MFFFFQAEDGIRDKLVTGVQTCALPISFLNVSVANSIDNRLTKLLQYLTLQYPDEGWDRFLLRDKPKWSQIAVSGHSQGGGNAAMRSEEHTSELQSLAYLVCRLLLEKKKKQQIR